MENIHVGQLIGAYLNKERIYKSSLARAIGVTDSQILYYQKSKDLKPSTILKISNALKHNFFADLAAQLPTTYTTDAPKDTSKDEEIAQLKRRIEILEAQVEVLRK